VMSDPPVRGVSHKASLAVCGGRGPIRDSKTRGSRTKDQPTTAARPHR
jgi:hypothetical protein